MSVNRDDFNKTTKDILAKRVGYLCSNPECRKLTIGPNEVQEKATSIGIAAHITAASAGGPRYDEDMTNEKRSHIDNGIWLCSNCATLIDKDIDKFPKDLLSEWKQKAEEEAFAKINGEGKTKHNGTPYIEADLIWTNGGRYTQGYSRKNPIIEYNGKKAYDVSRNPIVHWDLQWNFSFVIYNNSKFPAYNLTVESIGKEHFTQLDKLEKINNLPPFMNLDLKAKFNENFEGTSKEADVILKDKIPLKFKELVLKITYSDDDRNIHTTIITFRNGQIINSKE